MSKHTEGPWHTGLDDNYDQPQVLGSSGELVAVIAHECVKPQSVLLANACLIAAVPELFAFANHPVMEWLMTKGLDYIPEPQRTSVNLFLVPMRNAAIAKAEAAG